MEDEHAKIKAKSNTFPSPHWSTSSLQPQQHHTDVFLIGQILVKNGLSYGTWFLVINDKRPGPRSVTLRFWYLVVVHHFSKLILSQTFRIVAPKRKVIVVKIHPSETFCVVSEGCGEITYHAKVLFDDRVVHNLKTEECSTYIKLRLGRVTLLQMQVNF